MRYEPLYGLQKPFDNGPADSTAYGMFWNKILYYKIEKTSVYCFDTDDQWSHVDGAPNVPFLAMRRIKETPDSQLVVDGMPSFYVGSSGACTHKMAESDIPVWCNDVDDTCTAMGFINDCLRLTRKPNRWTIADQKAGRLPEVGAKCRQGHKDEIVVAVTEKFVVTECQDMSVCTTRKDVFMRSYNPIETPEEKAVRLRHEWNEKAHELYWNESKNSFYDLYDAMLSGVLETPQAMQK